MKKKLYLLLLLLSIGIPDAIKASCPTDCNTPCNNLLNCDDTICSCPCTGKTYFSNRPLFHSYRGEFIAGFRNDRMQASQEGKGGAFDIVPFGGQSSDADGLASYFLPFCQNPLVFNEDLSGTAGTTDILSTNFNIITVNGITTGTPFKSTAQFCARHDEYGVGFHWKQGFGFCDSSHGEKWWYVDISMPVETVRNIITIDEAIQSNGGGPAVVLAQGTQPTIIAQPNVVQAFAQSAWNFGKIVSGCFLTKTGVGDVELKFGRQWMYTDDCNMASYIGVWIPTGNTPCGQFVFEPILGNGNHWGIIWGGEGTMDIWADCDHAKSISFAAAAQMQYFFNRKQVRSFDVKGRPWSRYIPVYANQAQANFAAAITDPLKAQFFSTPGINVFTQCVNVVPGLQVNSTTALLVEADNGFQGELGYNFFGHHQECVSLASPWQVGPAFISTDGAGSTNPYRTITTDANLNGTDFDNDSGAYPASLIHETDLDLQSAAHPYYFAHNVYVNLGHYWDDQCYPTYIGVGGSYEFALHEFAAMKRWTVWGKFNIAF